jgi:hypothetical protein
LASKVDTNLDEAISGLAKLAVHTGYVSGSSSGGSGEDQYYRDTNVSAHGITDYTKCIVILQAVNTYSGPTAYKSCQTARLTSNTNLRMSATTNRPAWSDITGRYYIIEIL